MSAYFHLRKKLIDSTKGDTELSSYLEYLMLLDTHGISSTELKLKYIRDAEQFLDNTVLKGK
jgi:hypothetical protein